MVRLAELSPELARAIERSIQTRTHGRMRDLSVELAGQEIVLKGRAPSYYTKQLAQHGAMDAVSGGRIINQIVIM